MDKNKIAISTYEKIADIYTKKYYSDLSDTPFIDIFLNKLKKGSCILDVGCGPGQFVKYMMSKGFNVIGVDYSKKMLEIAREKVPNGDFRFMDIRTLDFADRNFDGILAAYSLIHIKSEEIPKTLSGFKRVLKPGAYIEIIVQRGEADKIINEPFMPSEKIYFNFFTGRRLRDYLEKADFSIEYQKETDTQDSDSGSDMVIYTIAKKNK